MKYVLFLLFHLSLLSMPGCSEDSANPAPEIMSPEVLADSVLEFQGGTGLVQLTLENGDSAKLYWRPTSCCWSYQYGSYVYERQISGAGNLSVTYELVEYYSTGSLLYTEDHVFTIQYILQFADETSGDYSMVDESGNATVGTFSINPLSTL